MAKLFPDRMRPPAMLPAALVLQVAKRVGLAPKVVGFAFRNMLGAARIERAFEGYEPTAHDVFVTTYAKSGTNWMLQIAQQIAWHGAAEFEHIHEVAPWPDGPGGPIGDLTDHSQLEASPTGLRIIKTHLATDHVPYHKDAAYLTVLRDPKEVMVSAYYFLGGIFDVLDHLTFDQWFELGMRPEGALMTGWAKHTAGFWAWRERPNVIVLNYREILAAPAASIEEVARVMGVALEPAQLEAVVERASFPYMQAHESQFAPPRLPLSREKNRAKMIRRGKSDSSEELLSLDQQKKIDELCQTELERLGSDFPYTTAFRLAGES